METPATNQQITQHTSPAVNRAVEAKLQDSVTYYRQHPNEIEQRLETLDKEWDIERALETNASSIILAGSALGFFADRRFFALPAVVAAFLLQHAIQGWCPPLPLLRKLGFRTSDEIQRERNALLALRGSH